MNEEKCPDCDKGGVYEYKGRYYCYECYLYKSGGQFHLKHLTIEGDLSFFEYFEKTLKKAGLTGEEMLLFANVSEKKIDHDVDALINLHDFMIEYNGDDGIGDIIIYKKTEIARG